MVSMVRMRSIIKEICFKEVFSVINYSQSIRLIFRKEQNKKLLKANIYIW